MSYSFRTFMAIWWTSHPWWESEYLQLPFWKSKNHTTPFQNPPKPLLLSPIDVHQNNKQTSRLAQLRNTASELVMFLTRSKFEVAMQEACIVYALQTLLQEFLYVFLEELLMGCHCCGIFNFKLTLFQEQHFLINHTIGWVRESMKNFVDKLKSWLQKAIYGKVLVHVLSLHF